MCWSDECLLVCDVHVNVSRPACREIESVSAAGKNIACYDQMRQKETGSMQCSASCLFFSIRICIFIDLLAYFVFMRFTIKFHHASCVIFYNKEGRRKLELDGWMTEPGRIFFFFFMRIFLIYIKRYSRGYKCDTATFLHDLLHTILICILVHQFLFALTQ